MHFNVDFLIGGDGPKIVELEQMREKHQTLLGDRVKLLGSVKHEEVREVSQASGRLRAPTGKKLILYRSSSSRVTFS